MNEPRPILLSETPDISDTKRSIVRSLAIRKLRHRRRLFLLEGERLVGDALAHPDRIRFVFGTEEGLLALGSVPDGTDVVRVEDHRLFATDEPQGVGAVVSMAPTVDPATLLAEPFPLLVLDRIRDPGNAGTIIRTADWFGAIGLLFSVGSVDPWNPKGVRASMGSILRVPIATGRNLSDLDTGDRPVIVMATDGESIEACTLPENGIYVIGSEAEGADPELIARSDRTIRIPQGTKMPETTAAVRAESLNAAISASILCWELSRRTSTR